MHKTFLTALIIATSIFISATPFHHNRLNSSLQKIKQLPEANELLKEIEQEGAIRFALIDNHEASKFGAFWDLEARMIAVNPNFHKDEGAMIGSILFEMQNAKMSRAFNALFNKAEAGLIDRESYIRAIEHIEYENSKRASKMADSGIRKGLFQPTAGLPTYNSFEEHYYYQQYGGHAQQIGIMYDRIAPSSRGYSRNG